MKTVQFTPLGGVRGGFHLCGAMSWRFSHTWHHINQITDQKEKTEGAKGKLPSSHREIKEQMGAVRPLAAALGTTTTRQRGKEGGRWRSQLAHAFRPCAVPRRPTPLPISPSSLLRSLPRLGALGFATKFGASTSNSSSPVSSSFPGLVPPLGGASRTHPRCGGLWWREA
jgi:hypothetical protein